MSKNGRTFWDFVAETEGEVLFLYGFCALWAIAIIVDIIADAIGG